MMTKKAQGGNMMMIFSFLILLIIIGGGIALGSYMFFGTEYDARQVESNMLNHKIRNCLSEQNISLDSKELEKEIFEKCSLNEKTTKDNFALLIKLNGKTKYNWKSDETLCSFTEKNDELPRCTEETLSIENNEITILTSTNQKIRRKIA